MKIYKYPVGVGGPEVLPVHPGARIVHFADQHDQLNVWVEVDPDDDRKEERILYVIGTGWDTPPKSRYIATCMSGPFVWHLYEVYS